MTTEPLHLGTAMTLGDGGQYVATTMVGTRKSMIEINVYESLTEPGKVVIDVLTNDDADLENLIVTLNDGDLHRESGEHRNALDAHFPGHDAVPSGRRT